MKAQIIKIENGISISHLNKNKPETLFDKALISYNFSLQMDYLEKDWFYLSSGIGYLEKGGKGEIPIRTDANSKEELIDLNQHLQYITVNTLFNFVYRFNNYRGGVYVGAGPRIDLNVKSYFISKYSDRKDSYPRDPKFIYGMKYNTGFLYELNRDIQLGVNFSWLPSFNKPFKGSDTKEQTFTLGVSVGYLL